MSRKLDLSGEGKASNLEIEIAANEIFNIMRIMDSPKDAASIFALAHFKLISASFLPRFRNEALAAIDSHHKLLKEFISEGWQ